VLPQGQRGSRETHGNRQRKSEEEQQMEAMHRAQVARLYRQDTMRKLKRIWDRPGVEDKNPWNPKTDDAMFWM
jgi:hypothetical protein